MSNYYNDDSVKDENEVFSDAKVSMQSNLSIKFGEVQLYTNGGERHLKNVVIISFSYFLFYTAVGSLGNLESTMNAEQGIGPDSEAVIYICSMLSCLLPQLLIQKFGAKTTYFVALMFSCSYIAANFRLRWDLIMIAAVFYGISLGPLSVSMYFYLDEMTLRYQVSINGNEENIKSFLFGVQAFFGQITRVLGNTISYLVLKEDNDSHFNVSGECGFNFSSVDVMNNTNMNPPSSHERTLLTGVYLVFGAMGVFVTYFLEPLRSNVEETLESDGGSETYLASILLLKNSRQILLVPLSIYIGLQSAFYSNDFTEVSYF